MSIVIILNKTSIYHNLTKGEKQVKPEAVLNSEVQCSLDCLVSEHLVIRTVKVTALLEYFV